MGERLQHFALSSETLVNGIKGFIATLAFCCVFKRAYGCKLPPFIPIKSQCKGLKNPGVYWVQILVYRALSYAGDLLCLQHIG